MNDQQASLDPQIFDFYKLTVEIADRVSSRCATANTLFPNRQHKGGCSGRTASLYFRAMGVVGDLCSRACVSDVLVCAAGQLFETQRGKV